MIVTLVLLAASPAWPPASTTVAETAPTPPQSAPVTSSSTTVTDSKQAPEPKPKDGLDMRVFWKDGFRMETADKEFTLRISGRFQNDWAWFSADEDEFVSGGIGELNDGTEIRRAYLGVDGKLFTDIEYKLEWDLSKSGNDFADAYMGTRTSIGNVRVGHFKQPFGLEELTSDVNTTFMERSLSPAFKLGRDVGAQLSDSVEGDAFGWAVGVFRDTNGNGSSSSDTSDDEYSFTGRVNASPWYADEGKKVLHLGLDASHRNPGTEGVTFSTKPEANLAPTFLTTGAKADADKYDLYGAELATVLGSLSLQGEYYLAQVDGASAGGDDPDLTGYYVFMSYFLTGEHRNYKRAGGTFDRVKPNHNFSRKDGGSGAWELGLRYTSYDFSDAVAGDATLDDITAGVNWYLNPFTKIQFNVIRADVDVTGGVNDDAYIYQVRFQFDF